ncbi:hypothetical protein [Stenotrophomonas sp.]|uniref:hypothetical protein n=1 Tax=Stenotrophomonas sp. TaxID=69392 RepID=UPI00289BDDF1|nr:hypothetical protein [Stenotrophomonas sp.]
MNAIKFLPLAGVLLLTACNGQRDAVAHDVSQAPADAFMAAVAAHCGKAFEGRVAVNEPRTDAADPFDGKRLVMHVRGCEDPAHQLRIPFHVGDDHSRTWVLSRTDTGLRLKHDHRHEDGSPDAVTMYGGDSTPPGTAQRQAFPVDADSVAMFRKADMAVSTTNTWAMEIEPDERFVYELTRPDGRRFQVVFDLSKPVALPPAPWGG